MLPPSRGQLRTLAQRHRAILDLVRIGDANVEQLSAALRVSEATVRRDLTMLAKQRHLVRTYGGATAVIGVHEPEASLEERKTSQWEQKDAIAQAAAAHHLCLRQDVHVVTNNLLAVMTLVNAPGVRLTLIGGDLRGTSMSTLGPLAELTLSRLSVDKAFLGADGVVAEFGLCEASAQQAYIKGCIIRRAAQIFVLADTDKLGRARQQHWTPIEREWRLITCATANEAVLAVSRSQANYRGNSDPEDLQTAYALEALTNDRLLQEAGVLSRVLPVDRISGPGSSPVMAAFTHITQRWRWNILEKQAATVAPTPQKG